MNMHCCTFLQRNSITETFLEWRSILLTNVMERKLGLMRRSIKENPKTSRYYSRQRSEEKCFHATGMFQCVWVTWNSAVSQAEFWMWASHSTNCTYQWAGQPEPSSHGENKDTAAKEQDKKNLATKSILEKPLHLCQGNISAAIIPDRSSEHTGGRAKGRGSGTKSINDTLSDVNCEPGNE